MNIFLKIVVVINIVAIDLFLYLLWNGKILNQSNSNNDCSVDCENLINEKISNLKTPAIIEISPTITPTPTIKTTAIKTKSTQYIPIPGSGGTLENSWTNLPGTEFYISTDDYPNLVGAYFESNMKLLNGNGLAYIRLFDITAGIEVWGSEVSTNSQSFTSISSDKLTIRSGTHLYRVQAKSLTADTTVFNSGRIKIILEN